MAMWPSRSHIAMIIKGAALPSLGAWRHIGHGSHTGHGYVEAATGWLPGASLTNTIPSLLARCAGSSGE
jgi:hypothetical protein